MKKKILSLLLALCLVVGLLPMIAMAEEVTIPEKYIRVQVLQGTETAFWGDVYMAPGNPTMYLVTNEAGAAAEGTAENWNIKMEYPADGTATLTFKGAYLCSAYTKTPLQINANVDLKIVVETDSTIFSDVKGVGIHLVNSGKTTITGPGKLTVKTTNAFGIWATTSVDKLDGGSVLIKDINMDIQVGTAGSYYGALYFTGGDMTIDNSKINIVSNADTTMGIWGHAVYKKDANGVVTSITSTNKGSDTDTTKRNLIIQNGSVITGAITGKNGLGCTGDIIIKDSTVDLSVSGTATVLTKKPVLEGNYTAIASENADGSGAVTFDENNYTKYKYFKITPKAETPAPSEPTTPAPGGTTNPSTGDTFSVALVATLALASLATLAVTVIGKKKAI